MATNTYVALDKITVGSAVSSVTFNSISSAYTDLVLVASNLVMSGSSATPFAYFNGSNGSTAAYYSGTMLEGNGSSAQSGRRINNSNGVPCGGTYVGMSSTNPTMFVLQVMNYSNTTTYKTTLCRYGLASAETEATVGLWRGSTGSSTEAITSITIKNDAGQNFTSGSTFSLYGIAAQPVATAKATGGTITYAADGYTYHTFTSSGTFTPNQALTCDALVVAGGGGAGYYYGGGGGAGGIQYAAAQALTATGYAVTIGAGGASKSGSGAGAGATGTDSSLTSLVIAKGGGYGNGAITGGTAGGAGGSGGGAGGPGTAAGGTTVTGTGGTFYGFSGGGGPGGGSGGGSGQAGASLSKGGNGTSVFSQWGLATSTGQNVSGTVYYAGGGEANGNFGGGGYGGGGATTTSGTANTGGGGGADQNGGGGGSGLVIIRYAS